MILRALGPTSYAALGTPIGLGCGQCALLDLCGGTTDFDCHWTCCGNPAKCSLACPRAHGFTDVIRDAGGMGVKLRYAIGQSLERLPLYIPHIQNGSCRSRRLDARFAALTTFDVSTPASDSRFADPKVMRAYFALSDDTEVVLLSIAKDNRLEHHWRYSESRQIAQYLAALKIAHITAPNFSFALNEPRPEHLVNRSRSLLEAERMSAAGLSVIPHVNAFNQKDWNCWRDFLRNHPHISMIVQEFQTGLASRNRAKWHVYQLLNIQESLGRPIHLMAVGGRRHLPLFADLSGVTIVDANPFIKTHMRQKLVQGKWQKDATAEGVALDALLESNIAEYAGYVEARAAAVRGKDTPVEAVPVSQVEENGRSCPISELQLSLWPSLPATA